MSEREQIADAQQTRDLDAMRACVRHARDLVESAKVVYQEKRPNIAFHLALLALEELGRRELIGLQQMAERSGKDRPWQKHASAHAKKLFWCFFGIELFSEKLKKGRLDSLQKLSETLHEQRLAGLYVDYQDNELHIPADAIDEAYCGEWLSLADAQVQMAESQKLREHISQEELELQSWFLSITESKESVQQIFSPESMARLAELEDAKAWAQWLKHEFDKADAHVSEMLKQELERSQFLPEKGSKNKWRFRIRVISQSHTVRQKHLNDWNKTCDWIKLLAVSGKPNQLLIEFTLKENVPLTALWGFGFGISRHFVAALNLATMGFWWWHLPEHIDSYYERIEDLESNSELGIRRIPSLKVDWGANRVLSDRDLTQLTRCFVALPGPTQRDRHKPFDFYSGGLNFLAINDVHWQCEVQSFANFLASLRAMMAETGELQQEADFQPVAVKLLREFFPKLAESGPFINLIAAFDQKELDSAGVSLSDASFMKIICDTYFQYRMIPHVMKQRTTAV